MTQQMLDSFTYWGEPADAIALSPGFSFSPKNNFGIETKSWCTANHRGFWCDYAIETSLVIKNLYLYSKNHSYPLIKGRNPEEIPMYTDLLFDINKSRNTSLKYLDGFPMQYIGINYDYEYTGRIVLAVIAGPVNSNEKKYQKFMELCFDAGTLTDGRDITELIYSVDTTAGTGSASYWWQKGENDYFELINYHQMGIS